MSGKMKTIIGIAGFFLFVVIAVGAYRYLSERYNEGEGPSEAAAAPSEDKEAVMAVDFTVYDADGNEVTLSEKLGVPLVINLWTSWCTYCDQEMPYFEELAAQYDDDTLQVLMIDIVTDEGEEAAARRYIEDRGYTFEVLYDRDLDLAMKYGINSFPITIYIAPDGEIIKGVMGMTTQEALLKNVEELLEY